MSLIGVGDVVRVDGIRGRRFRVTHVSGDCAEAVDLERGAIRTFYLSRLRRDSKMTKVERERVEKIAELAAASKVARRRS